MSLSFDPKTPLTSGIEIIENAVIVPWGDGKSKGFARPAGVFYPDGTPCDAAVCYRSADRATTLSTPFPDEEDISETISGTVLFGGIAYGHFGHALCESLGRLWALDDPDLGIEKIYFHPKQRKTWVKNSLSSVRPMIETLGVKEGLFASNDPIRVERLVVAPQGFGVNELILGSPEFRSFIRGRLQSGDLETADRKIFVSRSKLYSKRGRILQENIIEQHLEAEGYEIFHPQEHSLAEQLDAYRNAKVLISTDNSALHLAAFVVPKEAAVAILIRRPSFIYKDFVGQLKQFANIDPVIIETGQAYWAKASNRVQLNEVYAQVDFPKMGAALKEAGFVSQADWPEVDQKALQQQISTLSENLGYDLEPVKL
ncbi:MAG: glycosyltransferase family 61 protein [Pseudoruegeria sp.]